jgi:tetratricopeptide (TPR) repeat protein
MMDHLTFDQLCDLEDGALDAADSASARAHMKSCADCASRHAALATLGAAAAALPREIAPPDDLWEDIRGQLRPRGLLGVERFPRWRVRHLAAAAAVIAIASSALTALILRGNRADPATQSAQAPSTTPVGMETPVADLPARLASTEHGYARSVEALQRTLDVRRDSLAPSTVATVERSLRVADSAIAEARSALARDPANRALVALFASNYERKIDLLRRATELAPRT